MSKDVFYQIADTVRVLSAEAVQKAGSGHPGLPLGCAEVGTILYTDIMNYNVGSPKWFNRDRFVLSAGHGSMLLYSLLHLSGFKLGLEELKNFRQLGSKTPGHPEYGHTEGVEITTGPLGQGLANAVGMAIARKMMGEKFNTASFSPVSHKIYVLAGDGCLMEGISSEASSLAGHLGLCDLIMFYDSNQISIEGNTDLAFTEDVAKRYEAYGWNVLHCDDAYNKEALLKSIEQAKRESERPTMIVLKTTIAYKSPTKAGSHKAHGEALGTSEVEALKTNLGLAGKEFFVPSEVKNFFETHQEKGRLKEQEWNKGVVQWKQANPHLVKDWEQMVEGKQDFSSINWPQFKPDESMATRKASGECIKAIAQSLAQFLGGSADLEPSNNTNIDAGFQKGSPTHRTLRYGVREHAMGAIVNGLSVYASLKPFGATFLTFSDYMRPAIRLAALMRIPSIFIFTHDSVLLGEDGPTHQPVEHLAALRTIPNLLVLRPGDAQETVQAWKIALEQSTRPTALILTRQNLQTYAKPDAWQEQVQKMGAYVAFEPEEEAQAVLLATGSEVSVGIAAAKEVSFPVKVVSVLSKELLESQSGQDRKALFSCCMPSFVFETGVRQGWEAYAGCGHFIGVNTFGASAPFKDVQNFFGLDKDSVKLKLESAWTKLKKHPSCCSKGQ